MAINDKLGDVQKRTGGEELMKKYLVKIVDTNGVVSDDKVFFDREEAEVYINEKEKYSTGWELQLFEYPITNTI